MILDLVCFKNYFLNVNKASFKHLDMPYHVENDATADIHTALPILFSLL